MAEPGIITKGMGLERLDKVMNDPNRRDGFLQALKYSEKSVLQIQIDYGVLNALQIAYLSKRWFTPNWAQPNSGCEWPEFQPIEPVFRQGLITAIEMATLPPEGDKPARLLPIHTCWVCGVNDFQMAISVSDYQVTCLILTPPVSPREVTRQRRPEEIARLTADSPIVLVKRGKEHIEPWEIEIDKDDRSQVVIVRTRRLP